MNQTQTAQIDTIVRDADLLHCAHATLRTDNAEVQRFLSEVSWQLNAMHKAEDAGRRFEQFIVGADVACENGWTAMIQARKEEDATASQDRSCANAEGYADMHDPDGECDACAPIIVPDLSDLPFLDVELGWSARLASRAAAIVSAAGGLALAIACLTGTPASAHTLPLVPTDGACVITRQFEDGGATALCGPDDAWAYDADGNNPPESSGYTGPRWDAGWYPCVDASCARIDHAS